MTRCNCGRRQCVECEVPQRARNAYFTGKLLVERDFTDEQRYFVGKGLRHNRRLHGSGTVSGLKVTAHRDPNCRDRFVVVEPGTAVDSCGHEILVEREHVFDLRERFEALHRELHPEATSLGDRQHRVQVCLRYAECASEPVPVLFDDRGGDACQPNRVLETYEVDLRLDPPDEAHDPSSLRTEWRSTVTIAGAHRVAVDEANERLYVLTAAEPARLFVASTRTLNVLRSHTYHGHTGHDVAVAPGGERVYVAVHDAGSREAPDVLVLDDENLHSPINSLPLEGAGGGRVRLAVAPDGRLLVLVQRREEVWIWGDEVNRRQRRRPPHATVPVGEHPAGLAVSPDGRDAYVANRDSESLTVVRMADPDDPVEVPIAGVRPSALAVTSVAGEDHLVVLDRSAETLHLYAWRPHAHPPDERLQALGAAVPLEHDPLDVAMSPGGTWAFALSEGVDSRSYLQAVDLHAVQLGREHAAGRPHRLGDGPQAVALGGQGLTLYVPFSTEDAAAEGGVAVVELHEERCEGRFERIVEGRDDGGAGDCVVLATIEGYRHGERVEDRRIDNLRDRRLLPATDVIAEVVRCMLESGWGTGARGPQGAVGPPGPHGEAGAPGIGLSDDYAHLCAISWTHAGEHAATPDLSFGFDRDVLVEDLLRVSEDGFPEAFAVLRQVREGAGRSFVEMAGTVQAGRIVGCDLGQFSPVAAGTAVANAVRFLPVEDGITAGGWRVVIRGDLIRDERGLAADLDFLPRPPDRPWSGAVTGDRVEGGTFHSFFTVKEGVKPS